MRKKKIRIKKAKKFFAILSIITAFILSFNIIYDVSNYYANKDNNVVDIKELTGEDKIKAIADAEAKEESSQVSSEVSTNSKKILYILMILILMISVIMLMALNSSGIYDD